MSIMALLSLPHHDRRASSVAPLDDSMLRAPELVSE
jgi:hypothetical protein